MRRKGCGEAGDRQYEAITLRRCRKELQGTQALRVEAGLAVDRGGNSGSEVRSWGLSWKAYDNRGQRKQPRNREWGRDQEGNWKRCSEGSEINGVAHST